ALTSKKYDEAAQLAEQARRLNPQDLKAPDLLARIAKARAGAGMADRAAKVKRLVADANNAIVARRFDDAAKLLAEASQLSPDDPGVAKSQAVLKQGQGQLTAYSSAMSEANKSLSAKRYDDALRQVALALKIVPGDKDALDLQKQIEKAKIEGMSAQI